MLAQEIQQRRLDRGTGVNCDAKVERLHAASARVPVGELVTHRREQIVVSCDGFAEQDRLGIFERPSDALTARHFADADMSRAILDDQNVASEEGAMRSA